MATIRAAPRSRSASQVVPIYEDPVEETVPVHDIHLDNESDLALIPGIKPYEAPEKNQVLNTVQDFEELASPEHDAALAAEYDDPTLAHDEDDHEDDDYDDDLEEEDPFETSDLTEDGQDICHSIEHDTPFRHERFSSQATVIEKAANHGYDRNFSTTTAIYLDDKVNSQPSPENENARYGHAESKDLTQSYYDRGLDYVKSHGSNTQARQASDTWSSLPDEPYYKSPLPGRNMLTHQTRSPLSASRSHLASPASPSPLANRERLLSSPSRSGDNYINTPTRQNHMGTMQYLEHEEEQQSNTLRGARQAFRNPSSVIRMQMSSPPPFSPGSPRSARHIRGHSEALRGSRHGSPYAAARPGSSTELPSRHENPNKEYPLVLLHCTLSPLPSTFNFSPKVLEKVLPSAQLRDLALLKERLGSGGTTVLERGVLLSHPGDDYELLEERILESLELRRPRVGGCGHFNSSSNLDSPPSYHSNPSEHNQDDADCKCSDCGRHVDHTLLDGGQAERRWDVRVYAANGLMRSGAWSAAWREMEKVDVEVGIYLSDHARQALERASKAEELLQRQQEVERRETHTDLARAQIAPNTILSQPTTTGPPRAITNHGQSSHSQGFSIDSTSQTRPRGNVRASTVQFNRSRKQQRTTATAKLPLQTLLWNYVVRTCYEQRGILCALAILFAGVFLALTSGNKTADDLGAISIEPIIQVETSTTIFTTTATEVLSEAVATASIATEVQTTTATETTTSVAVQTQTTTATATETTTAIETTTAVRTTTETTERIETATVTATVTVTETTLAQATATAVARMSLDACTFAEGDGADSGMTALPATLARSVLDAILPEVTPAAAGDDAANVQEDVFPSYSDGELQDDMGMDVNQDQFLVATSEEGLVNDVLED